VCPLTRLVLLVGWLVVSCVVTGQVVVPVLVASEVLGSLMLLVLFALAV